MSLIQIVLNKPAEVALLLNAYNKILEIYDHNIFLTLSPVPTPIFRHFPPRQIWRKRYLAAHHREVFFFFAFFNY